MESRPDIEPCVGAPRGRIQPPNRPAETDAQHTVSLIRRPSLRGRVALFAAILLGAGPGGACVVRMTQAIVANDAEVRTEASASDAGDAPTWDLTEQAENAWMFVERPARPEAPPAESAQSATLPTSRQDEPLPVFQLDAVRTPIELTEGLEKALSGALDAAAVEQAALASPPPTEGALPQSEGALPQSEVDLQQVPDAEMAQSRDVPAAVDTEIEYLFKPVPAPLAPPADSDPMQSVTIPRRGSTAGPAPRPFALPVPDPPARSTTDEPATQPVFVDIPPHPAAPLDDSMPALSEIRTGTVGGESCGSCNTSRCGVHCNGECACQDLRWQDSWLIPWEVFAQGEYIGPNRLPHVPEYRLRVDDQVEFVYRLTGEKSAAPYRINTGDSLRIESLTAENLNREVLVPPDGTISLTHVGPVLVAGRTIEEVRADLEKRYRPFVRNPSITVTPIKVNSILEELRATVDGRFGNGGQSRIARVTPEGTVQLPAIGSVPAHGLTLAELRTEIEYRYAEIVSGLEVTPILHERAPRYVYVLGEVRAPGRYTMEGPTTLMQAIALAGGWNIGANLKEVVVFRRDDCWRLMATRIGIRRALYGKDPCPDGEIWLRDSDIVVVPKSPILVVDEFIDLVFTRGVYGVVPWSTNLSYVRNLTGGATSVVPVP